MINDKYQFVEYENLVTGTLQFTRYNQIREFRTNLRSRQTLHKVACFGDTPSAALPHYAIANNTAWYINVGVKVWMSPKCRTPRDLVRNSGYKFVRDINDADFIIIPEVPSNLSVFKGNVIVLEKPTRTLCIFSITKEAGISSGATELTDEEYKSMKDRFDYRDADILAYCPEKKLPVQLLPKCDEWKALLINQYPGRKYMTELAVPINYPIDINVETLMIWKHANDKNMLAKSIVASNWKEYPVTLLYFLTVEQQNMNVFGGEQMKLVLDQIGWDKYADADDVLENRMIEPKDWNLLQDFIMATLDLPPEGGYIDEDKIRYSDYNDIVRKRVAVKPLKITEPMVFTHLKEIVEKS